MPRGPILLMMIFCGCLAACDRQTPATAAGAPPPAATSLDPNLIHAIAQAIYDTSPPAHPALPWPELAPTIQSAREQLEYLPRLVTPASPADPLAERASSAQLRALAQARHRGIVLRAESARLLAKADPDAAAAELAALVELARHVSAWGSPATAEGAADLIAQSLDAMEQPPGAPMVRALTSAGRAALRSALESLNTNDPAGRMRAMAESSAARIQALRTRAHGPDGPTVVRGVASRYAPSAQLGTPDAIDQATREAFAFSRALADGWNKGSRSAITSRLRARQVEDATGILTVLLGEAPDACDRDAALRARIEHALEELR
jgi:hypothetical protein